MNILISNSMHKANGKPDNICQFYISGRSLTRHGETLYDMFFFS